MPIVILRCAIAHRGCAHLAQASDVQYRTGGKFPGDAGHSMLPIIAGSVWLAASMPVPMSWLVAGGT